MAIIGVYDFEVVENATRTLSITRSGVATATGWSARLDIRNDNTPSYSLWLSLTSPSGGIVLTSDGSLLTIAVTITETQADALVAAAVAAGQMKGRYSLKLTKPDTTTEQLLHGTVTMIRTPTP